jgi:prephenate dehydratase
VSLRAGYLGPPGTFSEEALLAGTGLVADAVDAVPLPTITDVVLAVQTGDVDRGIVPIESAAEGSVDATLDALADRAPGVAIVGEVVLPVQHALIAAPGVAIADIGFVASHPQALAQCARFLRDELPSARPVEWTSTAEAVRVAASRAREGWAAIGTARAAELYGCDRLRDGIEDMSGNATRFVWLAPEGTPTRSAETKTTLAFTGGGSATPGWLVACLSEFSTRAVNLTRIESRPRRNRLGEYAFFLDVQGGAGADPVAAAIEGLRAHCDTVRVIGSYPAA